MLHWSRASTSCVKMHEMATPSTGPADSENPSDPNLPQQVEMRSSSKRTRSSDDVEPWNDLRDYMKSKKRKLDSQFQHLAQEKKTDIFKGVTIYVNGWTQPDADELKSLMHAHGGNYVYNTWFGTRITHVIATNLPNVKVRNIGDTVVCSPEWIVDSIAAGRQLPVQKYQLYSQNGSAQRRLRFKRVESKKEVCRQEGPPVSGVSADGARNQTKTVAQESCRSQNPDEVPSTSMRSSSTEAVPPGYHPSKGAEFVDEFFTHSRLHYLSTWSSELKQFTSKSLPQARPKYPKLPPTVSLRGQKLRAVVHIDIDCFFVSVSIRDQPHLKGKPVAVTHAKGRTGTSKDVGAQELTRKGAGGQGTFARSPKRPDSATEGKLITGLQENSEVIGSPSATPRLPKHLLQSGSDIASCSYEARRAGVHNGMWVGEALKLCPDLELVPYDFDSYHQVSRKFYETVMTYSSVIEPVSCDEAYIELTDYAESMEQVETIVGALRDEVHEKIGCTVSAGISHNMLLARMATRLAKPNGQFCLSQDNLHDFLSPQSVHDLPGVGYSMSRKLREMNVETCSQLKSVPLSKLQAEFGGKTGRMLYDYSRGLDNRQLKLEPERKSLSADINFGIRFADCSEAESFLTHLAAEVEKRAEDAQVLANSVTLKLKVRKPKASVRPRKYLGHGPCDNITRSHPLPRPTRSASEISSVIISLFKQLNLSPTDVRGVGIQLSKLVPGQQASGKVSTADIRTMMNPTASTTSTSYPRGTREDRTSDPPLPLLAPQSPEKDIYTHQAEPYRTDGLGCHLESVGAAAASSLRSDTAALGSELDSSFAFDLPPASQLDTSVLEALPTSLKDRILRTYSDRTRKADAVLSRQPDIQSGSMQSPVLRIEEPCRMSSPVDVLGDNHFNSNSSPCCVVEDESEFLAFFRAYLKDWVDHFVDGPPDVDVEKVTGYLQQLSRANLPVLLAILRYFRRLLTQQGLCGWYPAFNLLLSAVQVEVRSRYNGTLVVREIDL